MANFGVSVGDFIAIGNLAWNVYRSCKSASAEFEEVAREVISLHAAIKELEDEAGKEKSLIQNASNPKKEELAILLGNVRAAFSQLEKLVTKYSSLSTKHRKKWDIFSFGKEGVNEIRSKIVFHTSAINLFLTSLTSRSLDRIEKKLDEIVIELRRGDRDASSVAHLDEDVPEAEEEWQALKSELADEGFTKQDIEVHKDWIKARLRELLNHPGPVGTKTHERTSATKAIMTNTADVMEVDIESSSQNLNTSTNHEECLENIVSQKSEQQFQITLGGPSVSHAETNRCELAEVSNNTESLHVRRKRQASSPPPDHGRFPPSFTQPRQGSAKEAGADGGSSNYLNEQNLVTQDSPQSSDEADLEAAFSASITPPRLQRQNSSGSLATSVHSETSEYDGVGNLTKRTVSTTTTYVQRADEDTSVQQELQNAISERRKKIRAAQRAFRERRADYIKQLESQMTKLQSEVSQLRKKDFEFKTYLSRAMSLLRRGPLVERPHLDYNTCPFGCPLWEEDTIAIHREKRDSTNSFNGFSHVDIDKELCEMESTARLLFGS